LLAAQIVNFSMSELFANLFALQTVDSFALQFAESFVFQFFQFPDSFPIAVSRFVCIAI